MRRTALRPPGRLSTRDSRNGRTPDGVDEPEGSEPSRALRVLRTVAAPTTLLAALLYFFGQQQAHHFFRYFGVHHSVMGLSTEDYLLRSIDGLYPPMTAVAIATLAGLWGYRLLRPRLSDYAWLVLLRVLAPIAAVGGLALIVFAVIAVLDPAPFIEFVAIPGLCLTIGVLLLASVARLRASITESRRDSRPRGSPPAAVAEWTATFVLVSLGLFWAVGDYSAAVGKGRGQAFEANLSRMAGATVYSKDDLRLAGVPRVHCQGAEAAYRFRYDGLTLVIQSGGKYFLLPRDWTPRARAVVVPTADSLRLEFTAPATAPPPTC
ncbi:hypothetical protein EV193_101727 [Herbihabitans rhizosphaerae]|uniref:Uncharacterized protein n=1 Tax=Herbihabitans rhizosphaerae TaxID=1872711 RepID=A0A4Q7L686_9PSEU|nr:hypothetical protein EV193_101727 [Herbihabitans rhizosphaerae]